MRAWIDELLSLLGWDVQNTHQVLTEHTLNKAERARLHEIGSSNIRPDYTLVNGRVKLAFVDAKSLDVNIEKTRVLHSKFDHTDGQLVLLFRLLQTLSSWLFTIVLLCQM